MANLKENVLLTKDDIVSSKFIEKNTVVDTDKYGGQILKYHDIPLAAVWNGLQFAVENTYENEKQGIKILNTPIQLASHAAVNKHIKSFLVENQVLYSSITDKSSIEQFNKALADAATYAHCAFPMPKAERLIDAVYNLEKNEQGYIMPVSINGASINHSYTLSLTSEDISPSRQAADIALDKFINQLQTGNNPYGHAADLDRRGNDEGRSLDQRADRQGGHALRR